MSKVFLPSISNQWKSHVYYSAWRLSSEIEYVPEREKMSRLSETSNADWRKRHWCYHRQPYVQNSNSPGSICETSCARFCGDDPSPLSVACVAQPLSNHVRRFSPIRVSYRVKHGKIVQLYRIRDAWYTWSICIGASHKRVGISFIRAICEIKLAQNGTWKISYAVSRLKLFSEHLYIPWLNILEFAKSLF